MDKMFYKDLMYPNHILMFLFFHISYRVYYKYWYIIHKDNYKIAIIIMLLGIKQNLIY